MRKVNTRELRDNLAEYLDAVQGGERVVVTRRGTPVAEIVRASNAAPSKEVAEALRARTVRRAGDSDGLRLLLDEPPEGEPADLVARVLADRST
jgi:prevent-host-death family protein